MLQADDSEFTRLNFTHQAEMLDAALNINK